MVTISKDTPCFYLTAVARNRLPAFRTEALKRIVTNALDEARRSGGFAIFAYVIMPNHLHVVTDGACKPSDVLRFVKGIVSRRVIAYLKEGNFHGSLEKLRHQETGRGHVYSLWEHHSNVMLLTSEAVFMQRVNYINQNPVRDGLVERAEDYRWSSARCWARRTVEDEPLRMDLDRIVWRKPR
ncbi:MAG: transposase [Acidobacteriia bacterium]|nr:transposase [Terriglobia bacterium]